MLWMVHPLQVLASTLNRYEYGHRVCRAGWCEKDLATILYNVLYAWCIRVITYGHFNGTFCLFDTKLFDFFFFFFLRNTWGIPPAGVGGFRTMDLPFFFAVLTCLIFSLSSHLKFVGFYSILERLYFYHLCICMLYMKRKRGRFHCIRSLTVFTA